MAATAPVALAMAACSSKERTAGIFAMEYALAASATLPVITDLASAIIAALLVSENLFTSRDPNLGGG
jgi:hypothetical protein